MQIKIVSDFPLQTRSASNIFDFNYLYGAYV